MIVLKAIAVILAAILVMVGVVLFFPANIRLRYREELEVFAKVGFLGFRLYPGEGKEKKKQKKAAKKRPSRKTSPKEPDPSQKQKPKETETKKSTGSLSEKLEFILDAVKKIMSFLGNKAGIDVEMLTVTVAKENAAETAIQFGICCGIVSTALAFCSNFDKCKINDDNVGVYPDFISGESNIQADISIHARVYAILGCALKILLAKP